MLRADIEKLLKQRYYQPGETWEKLVTRVVDHVCEGESPQFKANIWRIFYNRIALPNSPCLVNAGRSNGGLMACFVVGPDEDTIESHGETLLDIAVVGKRGGGAGFSGANIRAKNSPVAGSAHGFAYGPNAWATRVSEYLDMITQGGFRKMALMYSLPADHPDIEEFMALKHNGDEKFGYNFNQSVFASDEWMREAVYKEGSNEHRILWELAKRAHANGEPGLLFADRINQDTPYDTCECPPIQTTNPCGEQPLPSYGSCNLGSINLAHDIFYPNGQFNYFVLAEVVKAMTRFLDNVGTKNVFPNKKFKDWYEDHRPIGIGIMGYADALLRLGFVYGEEEATEFLRSVLSVIRGISYAKSVHLGVERGVPAHCEGVGRRNITTTSIAPTGSIAFIAGCSHGIEPVFAPTFEREDERGEKYLFDHPMKDAPHFRSSLNPDKSKMPTWEQHVRAQAHAQIYIDSGVSKTINMVNGVSVEDVYGAFVFAWQMACKGITIYRDGSRHKQVLVATDEDAENQACPSGVCEVPEREPAMA